MYQQDLLETNSESSKDEKLSKAISLNTRKKKADHISFLVKQCFSVLDSYGKSENDAIKLHTEHLIGLDMDVVTKAFRKWVSENPRVPTPADIIMLSQQLEPEVKRAARIEAFAAARWTQNILDYSTDDILEVRRSGDHLSPISIYQKYGAQNVYTRMQREA